jgi:hypothetical protein
MRAAQKNGTVKNAPQVQKKTAKPETWRQPQKRIADAETTRQRQKREAQPNSPPSGAHTRKPLPN